MALIRPVMISRITTGGDVGSPGKAGGDNAEHAAAENAHKIGPGGEAGDHQEHSEELGGDEELHGFERHGFHGVDFLVDLHGADFGGEGGAGTSDDHDGGHQRAEFAGHGNGDGVSDHMQGAEFTQLVSSVDRQNGADEKGN